MAQVVDARVLRDAMAGYLEALRAHREEIDSLNVFPVRTAIRERTCC
jgi:dihydroxyacetone kinase-like predicted kinase